MKDYTLPQKMGVFGVIVEKFLSPGVGKDGYLRVSLCKNGKQKTFLVHRLILKTYNPVENMNELTVNHKDEDKKNNCLSNLEWMTLYENNRYGGHDRRMAKTQSKSVLCVETGKIYDNASIAAREVGLNTPTHIRECCNGKAKTSGGYHWKYVKE